MKRFAIVASVALAACSSGNEGYNNVDVDPKEARAQARIDAAVNQQGARQVALSGVPVGTPTPNAARDRAFPTAFEGHWGAGPDDCNLVNVDAAGRINIDHDVIRVHDGKAMVQSLTPRSPTVVDTLLRYSGAGGDRTVPVQFRLEAGGTHLVSVERAPGAAPVTRRYGKC